MYDSTTQRMLLSTAVLAAVAALLAGPANAVLLDVEGDSVGAAVTVPAVQPGTIPYLSHGIGVDESQFSGQASPRLTGVHAALTRDRDTASSSTVEPGTIPYLSHGIGVDESQFSGQPSLGLTGDSALTRVAAPEPEGLTGDSALTRVGLSEASASGQATSSGSDRDWTWVGFGAGMAALLAAALMGIYLSARHRGRVALP